MPDKQAFDVTKYQMRLEPVYQLMRTRKREIATKQKRGLTPEGVQTRLKEARTEALAKLCYDAGAAAGKAEARMAEIEAKYTAQPVSSLGLDIKTHRLQSERDRAGALADHQLKEHVAGLMKDPAKMDPETASIYGAEARRRGLKDSDNVSLADTLAVEIAVPPHTRDAEWQALSRISKELRAWHKSEAGNPSTNGNPALPCMPFSVVDPSISKFSDAFDNLEHTSHGVEPEPEGPQGGIIGGGRVGVAMSMERDDRQERHQAAERGDPSRIVVGGGPNVL